MTSMAYSDDVLDRLHRRGHQIDRLHAELLPLIEAAREHRIPAADAADAIEVDLVQGERNAAAHAAHTARKRFEAEHGSVMCGEGPRATALQKEWGALHDAEIEAARAAEQAPPTSTVTRAQHDAARAEIDAINRDPTRAAERAAI